MFYSDLLGSIDQEARWHLLVPLDHEFEEPHSAEVLLAYFRSAEKALASRSRATCGKIIEETLDVSKEAIASLPDHHLYSMAAYTAVTLLL